MNRKYVFIAGFPRSGSTVFCNILAQNPRFRSDSVTSSLLTILRGTREMWSGLPDFKQNTWPELQKRVMRSIFQGYYADSNHPVIVDKHRGWPADLEMAEMLTGSKAKMILLVRDMRAIMSSWEKIWRRSKDHSASNIPFGSTLTVAERVKHWSSPGEPTGYAYIAIQDALQRGFSDRMLFVEFDRLTRDPSTQMRRVYQFIGEEEFKHNFNSIEQRQVEPDPEPWMKDIHVIRRSLEPVQEDWNQILGPAIERLDEANRLWMGRV